MSSDKCGLFRSFEGAFWKVSEELSNLEASSCVLVLLHEQSCEFFTYSHSYKKLFTCLFQLTGKCATHLQQEPEGIPREI